MSFLRLYRLSVVVLELSVQGFHSLTISCKMYCGYDIGTTSRGRKAMVISSSSKFRQKSSYIREEVTKLLVIVLYRRRVFPMSKF